MRLSADCPYSRDFYYLAASTRDLAGVSSIWPSFRTAQLRREGVVAFTVRVTVIGEIVLESPLGVADPTLQKVDHPLFAHFVRAPVLYLVLLHVAMQIGLSYHRLMAGRALVGALLLSRGT